ncbi:MAG: hypothetical protein K6U79_03715 [Firmicutes bacterium]|nr:hypothetical protein [Bacillota bacterium]
MARARRGFLVRRAGLLLLAVWLAAGCATGPASRAPAGSKRPPGSSPGSATSAVPGGGAAEPLRIRDLLQVRFVDALRGWAVAGSMILRTADGGASWWDVTPAGAGAGVTGWDGAFLDASHAWVVSQPRDPGRPVVLYRTEDGGRSWTASPLGMAGFAQVRFVDRRTGWILLHQGAGAGSEAVTLLLSRDGGASWQEVVGAHPGATGGPGLSVFAGIKSGAAFADARHAWLTGVWAGRGILLYRTADGGQSWSRQPLPVPAGLSADGGAATSYPPLFASGGRGVLPVLFENRLLVLYATEDGGATWAPSTPVRLAASAEGPPQFHLIDAREAVVTDGTTLYRTDDGGRTWSAVHPDRSLAGVQQLDFVDPSTGWALLPDPQEGAGATLLLRTRDGGRTWQPAAPPAQG